MYSLTHDELMCDRNYAPQCTNLLIKNDLSGPVNRYIICIYILQDTWISDNNGHCAAPEFYDGIHIYDFKNI